MVDEFCLLIWIFWHRLVSLCWTASYDTPGVTYGHSVYMVSPSVSGELWDDQVSSEVFELKLELWDDRVSSEVFELLRRFECF